MNTTRVIITFNWRFTHQSTIHSLTFTRNHFVKSSTLFISLNEEEDSFFILAVCVRLVRILAIHQTKYIPCILPSFSHASIYFYYLFIHKCMFFFTLGSRLEEYFFLYKSLLLLHKSSRLETTLFG